MVFFIVIFLVVYKFVVRFGIFIRVVIFEIFNRINFENYNIFNIKLVY